MSECVRRYEPCYEPDCTMKETKDGDYVEAREFDELQRKYDELERWDAIWRERVDKAERKYEELVSAAIELADEWETIEAPLCIKAYQRCIRELRALLGDR